MESEWFTVDRKGLAELQSGKPKFYAVRELIANAFDEDIAVCEVETSFNNGLAIISVYDDSEKGFRNIEDAYTLFRHTYKRAEPTKRGRFNVGEKQAFAICKEAMLETTKGTVTFTKKGRVYSKFKKTEKGSKITIKLEMTQKEYAEVEDKLKSFLIPKGITYKINGVEFNYQEPYKTIEATLSTELASDGVFRKTQRKTQISLHKSNGKSILYELGIPVQDIECQFSIDVQQKIPLSIDRETVSPSFLKDLFAEVLNHTFEEIKEEGSSDLWVRTAITDERINKEAVKEIIHKRYGENVCVANPFDPRSIDEAISKGFRVIRGAEMDKDEWAAIKKDNLLKSSTDLFGVSFVGAERITDLTSDMRAGEILCKKIAKRLLGVELGVVFVKSKAGEGASFDFSTNTLTFNLSRLGNNFFSPPVSARTIDLCLHELGHFEGRNHTEKTYHELLTKMAGELVMISLQESSFFEVGQK